MGVRHPQPVPQNSEWPIGDGQAGPHSPGNPMAMRRPLVQGDGGGVPLHPAIAQQQIGGPNMSNQGGAPRVQNFPMPSIPAPPTPPEHPTTDAERQMQLQYEQWLYHQQHVLSMQLKYFEAEVHKLRKVKKVMNRK